MSHTAVCAYHVLDFKPFLLLHRNRNRAAMMNRRRDHSLDDMEWDGEYDTGEGALPPPSTSVLNGWTLSTDDEKPEVWYNG